MISKPASLLLFFFLCACNSIEFVLEDYDSPNTIKEKVKISVIDNEQGVLTRELYSFLWADWDRAFALALQRTEEPHWQESIQRETKGVMLVDSPPHQPQRRGGKRLSRVRSLELRSSCSRRSGRRSRSRSGTRT